MLFKQKFIAKDDIFIVSTLTSVCEITPVHLLSPQFLWLLRWSGFDTFVIITVINVDNVKLTMHLGKNELLPFKS